MNFSILELAGGYISLVDKNDYEEVSKYNWCAIKQGNSQVRVMTKIDGKTVYLHSFLTKWKLVDHINGHSLDNRRQNLRQATNQQNSFNCRKPRTNTSGYKGVSYRKDNKKYVAYIVKNRKQYYLGVFKTAKEAAEAYNTKAKELFGEFARLNVF